MIRMRLRARLPPQKTFGELHKHAGAINSLEFVTGATHLLSAGADGMCPRVDLLASHMRCKLIGGKKWLGLVAFLLCMLDVGKLCVWQTEGGWDCRAVLEGHAKEVMGAALHPSGKLALSVGKDYTLRVWDMVHGKCALATNVKQTLLKGATGQLVRFSRACVPPFARAALD
jgi:WD40 repeat protein